MVTTGGSECCFETAQRQEDDQCDVYEEQLNYAGLEASETTECRPSPHSTSDCKVGSPYSGEKGMDHSTTSTE
ncbi:hypothetical protein KIN20_002781 [Parelaphostrongylus tenuis]|uniref:Uncharacterized protein n=1 Tax=Parelaphostrongylus tenuis TaxID=148309 RepID=A0AAD5M0B1_PARTN|nr:hypothetical protein KIN20_002781 [Parelaphostrongylus tenuis]